VTGYDVLAAVYEFLVPDALLEPAGAVAAFAPVIDGLEPGARVLDCAAGTGTLAVGLALRGFDVTASDASASMVGRAQALARAHGVALRSRVCSWDALASWDERFDAVLCVGNSLTHAGGAAARRTALAAMAAVLLDGGLLAVTSRNWELLRSIAPGLDVGDRLVERGGRRGLVIRSWELADGWDSPHRLDVAVAVVGADGSVECAGERLECWPFEHETLTAELRGAGLEPALSTWEPDAERYLVTARRAARAGERGGPARPPA